jgi:hypothetical protein
LDRGDESEADGGHQLRLGKQRANVVGDFDKAYGHEDGGAEESHPTRNALRRSGQVNKRESEERDEDRANGLQPGSPKYSGVVLSPELEQFGPSGVWGRTNGDGKRNHEQGNPEDAAKPAQDAE